MCAAKGGGRTALAKVCETHPNATGGAEPLHGKGNKMAPNFFAFLKGAFLPRSSLNATEHLKEHNWKKDKLAQIDIIVTACDAQMSLAQPQKGTSGNGMKNSEDFKFDLPGFHFLWHPIPNLHWFANPSFMRMSLKFAAPRIPRNGNGKVAARNALQKMFI